MLGLSLVVVCRDSLQLARLGFSLLWLLLLQGTGSGLVVGVYALSCPAVYGISLDQGSNSCPLLWQADDSQTLDDQGSPGIVFYLGDFLKT